MRWSEAGYLSQFVLTHALRQVSVSLILSVRQKKMTPIQSALLLALYGTPLAAGFVLVACLFSRERWALLAVGFACAMLFAFGGLVLLKSNFGGSGMGADWAAALAAVLIGVYACGGFLIGVGIILSRVRALRFIAFLLVAAGLAFPGIQLFHRLNPEKKTEPNKAVELSRLLVTDAANAASAPSNRLAHFGR